MTQHSAGILLFSERTGSLQVLLAHPGGPFWIRRDLGAWSIPKGEYNSSDEIPEDAARRELAEETGLVLAGDLIPLGEARQPSGKVVTGFAARSDFDPKTLRSNLFELEWPRHSGQIRRFPEIDRAQWFGVADARQRILPGQAVFVDRLLAALGNPG